AGGRGAGDFGAECRPHLGLRASLPAQAVEGGAGVRGRPQIIGGPAFRSDPRPFPPPGSAPLHPGLYSMSRGDFWNKARGGAERNPGAGEGRVERNWGFSKILCGQSAPVPHSKAEYFPMREREIFDAALAIADPAERSAYLAAASAGNQGLRRHIEELLDMHGQLGNFLESPASSLAVADPEPIEGPGTVIGPYKL